MATNKDLSIAEKVTVEADFDGSPASLHAFVTNVLAEEMWLATRLPDPRVMRESTARILIEAMHK